VDRFINFKEKVIKEIELGSGRITEVIIFGEGEHLIFINCRD